jgi:hypothetical protein
LVTVNSQQRWKKDGSVTVDCQQSTYVFLDGMAGSPMRLRIKAMIVGKGQPDTSPIGPTPAELDGPGVEIRSRRS